MGLPDSDEELVATSAVGATATRVATRTEGAAMIAETARRMVMVTEAVSVDAEATIVVREKTSGSETSPTA